MTAKAEVLALYTAAFELHATEEQLAVALGQYERAQDHRTAATLLVRAITAEDGNPTPAAPCACGICALFRIGLRRVV